MIKANYKITIPKKQKLVLNVLKTSKYKAVSIAKLSQLCNKSEYMVMKEIKMLKTRKHQIMECRKGFYLLPDPVNEIEDYLL